MAWQLRVLAMKSRGLDCRSQHPYNKLVFSKQLFTALRDLMPSSGHTNTYMLLTHSDTYVS